MCNIIQTTMLLLLVVGATLNNLSANSSSRNAFDGYIKTAEQFIAANPLEKVYLHLDNSSYFVGDTLWFKAYAVNAAQNRPTEESAILHVELLNPEGVIVRTQKYRLDSGKCDGSIPLDKELLSGFFEIRAYTKAMLNFGNENYFTRVFPIFEGTPQTPELLDRQRTVGYEKKNASKREQNKSAKSIDRLPEYNVTFYPEGGNMVMGLWSTVAFQIKDQDGKYIETSGKIYDRSGVVAEVRSTHLGIGRFDLSPSSNQYYMMIDGDETQYELPQPLKTGSVVSVDNLAGSNSVEISVASIHSGAIGVAIISRGEVSFIKKVTKSRSLTISKSKLSEGVNQVILYNLNNGQELASRLFYVKNGSQPQLSIEVQKQGDSAPHALQEVGFRVSDSKGHGVATNFSLSVYDDEGALGSSQNDIYTSLLLSSELRGYIPNAGYYFEADDEEHSRNLDLVMMVHGWSRYRWDDLNERSSSEMLFKYEKSLTIYGRVFKQYWAEYLVPEFKTNGNYRQQRLDIYDIPIRFNIPTRNVVPCSEPFLINFAAVQDTPSAYKEENMSIDSDLIVTKKLSRKNFGQNNRFNINYSDFFDEVNVGMNLTIMSNSKGDYKHSSGFFIVDSEYRPDERDYDYYEKGLDAGYSVKQEGDYPTISTRYFNRGKYSPFYDLFKFPVLDQAANKVYTSLDDFLDYYCDDYALNSLNYSNYYLSSSIIDNGYISTNELLYYNKMPYGTFSYIATMDDKRKDVEESERYTTGPLVGEGFGVGLPYTSSTIETKYNYVVDSTVVYSNPEKRAEIFELYKDSADFRVFSIDYLKMKPLEVSAKQMPDYIVEHFGRIVDMPKYIGYPSRNSESDQRKRVMVFGGLTSPEREFYSPDYSVVAPPTSGDHRRTLYWNPNVESDAEGRATVTFYNNSRGGNYTIDAQTITSDGQIGGVMK